MAQLFSNNGASTLASGISNVATSLTLATGQGALFPSPTGGDYFLLTLIGVVAGAETSWEIVRVTARATDVLTIVRAQEATVAATWATGTKAELRATAGTLTAKQDVLSAGTGLTLTGTVVALATPVSAANGGTGVTTSTGSGDNVLSTSPTLITPALGTPTALVGTNITGTAAAFNINGTVGATTPAAGAFTSVNYTGTLTGGTGVVNLGSGQLVKDSSGNVGIGTSSPATKVHALTASATAVAFRAGNSMSFAEFQVDASGNSQLVAPGGNQIFNTNGAERMRIDSSGNVGIGTSSPGAKLQVTGGYSTLGDFNSGVAGTSPQALGVSFGNNITNGQAESNIWNGYDPATYANTGVLFCQRLTASTRRDLMFLHNNGNVGIGTNSPSAKLVALSSTAGAEVSRFEGNYSTSGTVNLTNWRRSGGAVASVMRYNDANTSMEFGTTTSHSQVFITAGAEAMRLDSSGGLRIKTTSNIFNSAANEALSVNNGTLGQAAAFSTNATGGFPVLYLRHQQTGGQSQIIFHSSSGSVGSITTDSTTTAYNTSSDYRLKDTITPMTGALTKVSLLKPCTYKWKVDGSDGQGFIAHEINEVVPGCATGEKDAVDAEGKPQYQGIDTSFLVAILTAAIQEQQAMIVEMTARISALESN